MDQKNFEAFTLSFMSWYTPSFTGAKWLEVNERLFAGENGANLFEELRQNSKALHDVNYDSFQWQVEKWIEQALRNDIRLLTPAEDDYPQALKQSQSFPALLSLKGPPVWKRGDGLAVVGARKMASSSKAWMDLYLPEIMKPPYQFLVSGGAEGVDQYAHRTCLRMNFPTLAVLPSGLLKVYPQNFAGWLDMILQQEGAVISNFKVDQLVRKNLFHLRNRVLISLCETVVVVQAERRSGSYLSARLALDEGRRVGVVPGHPTERAFGGCLDLLYDGAEMFRCHQDVMSSPFGCERDK